MAYFEITLGHRSKNKTLNFILPSIGLFLIGNSILFFNDEMFHPSFYTLLPIIGVCLIIWFSNKDELITKILSTKLFVWIGLISYSLYLWHYPIFAFSIITEFTEGSLFNKLSFKISGSLSSYPFLKILFIFDITKKEKVIKIKLNIILNLYFLFLLGISTK